LVQRSLQSRPKTEQKPTRPDPKQISLCGTASRHRRASSEQQRSKVGFPIRKFTDQSLFAAPHDLSQRTTSFIASQRQGIHQIPLRHLIALIAKARSHVRSRFGNRKPNAPWLRKDQFCFKRIRGSERSGSKPTTGCSMGQDDDAAPFRRQILTDPPANASPHPAFDRMRFLFTMSEIEGRNETAEDNTSPSPAIRPSSTPSALRARRN
jgi:hypothetical protein